MDDPSITKNLRSKEKVQFMIEGTIDLTLSHIQSGATSGPQKRADVTCNMALVTTQDNMNHFALVFILKKSKKIDMILPLLSELQIQDLDVLNFVVYWDPASYDHLSAQVLPSTAQIPQTATLKLRMVCFHAGDKKNMIERIMKIKQYVSREPNSFANLKTHSWIWHYSAMVPKVAQTKHAMALSSSGPGGELGGTGEDSHDQFLDMQISTKDKLKETIELMKSSNKQMSQIAMNIFFKQELEKRQNEFVRYKDLHILTYTWNVNGQKPPCEEIEDIFTVKNVALDIQNMKINSIEDIPDLIIFNFQEIVPLNAKSIISTGLQPQIWEKYLVQEFNAFFQRKLETKLEISQITFVEKLASHVQMGLFQIILYKKDIHHLISEFQLAQVGTGILGVGGNKGAIGCSIKVCETKIAVVNAHLAASQSKVQRRNQNVNQILKSLNFAAKNDETYNLFEHDILLWCGDLNYRINNDSYEDVVQKVKDNKLAELREVDQLLQEKKAGNVFAEFEEAILKFPPTYKFKVGTNDYDYKTSKIRIPSWCDRILYRGENIQQMFYTSIASPTTSDHKPVSSLFKVKYKMIGTVQQKIVTQSILDYLKNLKDNYVPKLKMSTLQIDFTDVSYGDARTITLEIENTGDGLLEFEMNKLGSNMMVGSLKNQLQSTWLTIEPLRGVVKAGEKTQIAIKLIIQQREAQLMFLYKNMIETVAISTNEPDTEVLKHSITINVRYLRSCFGAPLSILNQCIGQESKSVRDELQPLSYDEIFLYLENRKLNAFTIPVPKELHKILNYILLYGKTKPNIFLSPGNLSLQRQLREKIDTNQPFSPEEDDVLTVAFVLMDFLQTLLTPILPIHILNELIGQYEAQGPDDDSILQTLLFRLPKDNSMAFVYLLSFFREMLSCSDKNKLTPDKISEILCECLVGEDKVSKSNRKKFKRENIVRADGSNSGYGKNRRSSPAKGLLKKQITKGGAMQMQPSRRVSSGGGSLISPNKLEDNMFGDAVGGDEEMIEEDEEVEQLSVEQLKTQLRYQGILLHFFS